MSAGTRSTWSAGRRVGRAWLLSVVGVVVGATSVGLAAPASATAPPASLSVTAAGGGAATTATPGSSVTATTTASITQTGAQQHTLANTWDSSRFTLAGTPDHPDGWPLDYTTDGGTTWQPSAPADLSTVNGVRARGSLTATATGNGQAVGVSNETSQWFTTTASSSFNASSSGDGWSTFFDETRVFNIHHHNGPNSIDCHELADGSVCDGFPVDLTDNNYDYNTGIFSGTYNYNTSSRPDGWVDLSNHHLWFPTSDQYSGGVGFGCLDVSGATPTLCATPFVTLAASGAEQDNPIDFARVGSRLYTDDSHTGELLCIDTSLNGGAGAPCTDQPYAGFASADTGGALITEGQNVYGYTGNANTVTCFDTTTNAACAGWTSPTLSGPGSARPFLAVPNTNGTVVALCVGPNDYDYNYFQPSPGTLQCISISNGSAWTPSANLAAAINANTPGTCCTPFYASGQTVGTKMFWPVSTDNTYATCFDVVKDATCANWPQQVNSIYTTRVDPYNPLCLFTNGDDGVVRSWDINTGQQSGCGAPPHGDMTADFDSSATAPALGCTGSAAVQGYRDVTLNKPTTGFDSATLTVQDSNGQPVAGYTDLPVTLGTPLDLTGLRVATIGATPTFHVTLHNVNTWVDAPDLTVRYTTGQPQLCVPLQVVAPCPTGSGVAPSSTVAVDPADISAQADVSVNGGATTSTQLTSTLGATSYDGSACFGAVTGSAHVSGGAPVSGATVQLTDGSTVLATTQTGAQGDYTFDLVYPGPYTVAFADAHHNTAPAAQTTTVSANGSSTVNAVYAAPPAPPAPANLVSTGVGVTPQYADVVIPNGDSVTLLDSASAAQTTVTTANGTYVLNPITGRITFTAAFGFHGTAAPVSYRVTDAYTQSTDATYTPTVQSPAGPTASNVSSTGVGVTPQHADVTIPTGGSVTLLDGANAAQTTVSSASGTYVLDPSTGRITFTPVLGFHGTAPAVHYRVTDAYGQTSQAAYGPSVNLPGGPTAEALTSTATGTTRQSVQVTLPAGGSLQLVVDGALQTSVTGPTGSYTVDGSTLTFVPVVGFHGEAPGVQYRVTDAYGQTADASYTPTVNSPAGPQAQAVTSSGVGTAAQSATIAGADGDTVVLLDGSGNEATTVTVAAQGTYVLSGTTITFTPQDGFAGVASGVVFRLRDAYGQTSDASYTPTVIAPPAAPQQQPTVTVGQDGSGNVSVACALPGAQATSCTIQLTTVVNGHTVVIGTGHVSGNGQVVVTLTPKGQQMLHRNGSLKVKVVATVKAKGGSVVTRTVAVRLRAKTLKVPVVHFATGSAVVPGASVKALKALRGKLVANGVSGVTCAGYTDAVDTTAANRSLALARARAVCAIVTHGLHHIRTTTLSFGESGAVGSNSTAAGRAANRRVTVRLTY